jgi:RNA polymerase sigma factor (sigma-70 family)
MDRAFERIYRRHAGDVYRYALAVLRNSADAEDVTQTTFLNAYRSYTRGERPRNAQNWLIAIAHNVCRQRFRQSMRRPEEVEYDDAIPDAVPDDEAPTAEDIQRALGQLAFNQRAALVMRELEGRSYAEIAVILGTSVSAVETLIFRARRALREQLEGSLTCGEAERAISRDIDGRLSRREKSALRGHLRACTECQRFARSQRAQRRAIKALCAIPLPTSLTSLFGGAGGSSAVAGGVGMKAAAFFAAGTVASGVGYQGAKRIDVSSSAPTPAAEVSSSSANALRHGGDQRLRAAPAPVSVISRPKSKSKAKHELRRAAKPPSPGAVDKAASAAAPLPPKAKPKPERPKLGRAGERTTRVAKPIPVRPVKQKKQAKPKSANPAQKGGKAQQSRRAR